MNYENYIASCLRAGKFTLLVTVILVFSHATLFAQTADEIAVRAVVQKNAEAFEKGNLTLIDKIWADDEKVTVIEAGNFDYGWRNFRDKHLGPELKAMQNRKFTASDIRVHINGNQAWATFAYRIQADFSGRHIDAAGAGAMAMEKIKNEWRIVMYSTSGKRSAAGSAPQPEKKMSDNPAGKESPFACNMLALNPEQRKQHIALIKRLIAIKQEIRELPNGYAFRYAADSVKLPELAEFIANEKLCCPFFDFALKVEREGGPLWLELTGREGVKAFIKLEFGF